MVSPFEGPQEDRDYVSCRVENYDMMMLSGRGYPLRRHKMALEHELELIEKNRKEYLRNHEGKYALIKGSVCHGFFDSANAAYEQGVELFGVEPFLIRQVLEVDQINEAPALMYGLICASV